MENYMIDNIYILQGTHVEDGRIIFKIGFSGNPVERCKQIARERATKVKNVSLIAAYEVPNFVLLREQILHNKFKDFNVFGEWFDLLSWVENRQQYYDKIGLGRTLLEPTIMAKNNV